MRYLSVILLVTAFTNVFAQNVEFKAANFKEKKEELKVVLDAMKVGDEFLELGNEAVALVKDQSDNFRKALHSYQVAYQFNPDNDQLNLKIGSPKLGLII